MSLKTPAQSNHNQNTSLKATLTLFDATAVGIGAIIGAGIFVVTGIVAGLAGSALIVSVLIAGVVSLLTALSTAELARKLPEEGGVYDYAHKMLSPFAGFITGWMWAISNIFVGATVSLGFAYYFSAVVPSVPPQIIAAIMCLLLSGLNTVGAHYSASINNILVIIKLLILVFFIIFGATRIETGNLVPFKPFAVGVIQGAYFIFFAFSGFARVSIIAGEVEHAARNVPKAILLSLGISSVVYILVGFIAVGVAGASVLGASNSPLADALKIRGDLFASRIVSLGALVATTTVLLTTIFGVSRMIYSMTENDELPGMLGKLHPKFDTPYYAIWLSVIIMSVLAVLANLHQVLAISTFASLFYYTIANLSALKLKTEERRYPRIISILGVVSCLGLLFFSSFETPVALIVGLIALIAGTVYYKLRERRRMNVHSSTDQTH